MLNVRFLKYLSELVNASFNLGKPWFLMHMHLYFFLNGVQFFLVCDLVGSHLEFDN